MKKLLCITLLLCFMATPAISQEAKIVAYKVVYNQYVDVLEQNIQSYMLNGWQPFGGISKYGKELMQAMVKYE